MKKIKISAFILFAALFVFYSCKSAPSQDDILPEEKFETEEEPDKENENEKINQESPENNTDTSESTEPEAIVISRKIMDKGVQTSNQLAAYFLSQNPNEDSEHIKNFAQIYIDEASTEGVNWDVAFAQMCLETGYLRFGGLVQPEFHNYCGLGAMDLEHPGCQFETEQMGIRAHIQHLQAYGTTEDIILINNLIDPRYGWVHKTKFIEDISGLTGTWATDPIYAEKLESILQRMEDLLNK